MSGPNNRDREVTAEIAYDSVHGDFVVGVIAAYREECVKAERTRVLDEVERNLRRILADDRAEQVHTIRDVLTVLVENALPKWREG